MPKEIVIMRHGLCSGNAAERASNKGDHSLFTDELRKEDSTTWPLLSHGVWQSQEAGRWIQSKISADFDYYAASDMTRASETAYHLGFPNAVWDTEPLLRERCWGGTESISNPERHDRCITSGISPEEDSVDWSPPGGESMRSVLAKMRTFLTNLHRDQRDKKILLVSHGAPIQAFRVLQHGVPDSDYIQFISGNEYLRNCHILHYYEPIAGNSEIPLFRFERSAFLNLDGSWSVSIREIK